MDRQALADREHSNMIEAMTRIGSNAPGALVRRSDGVAIVSTGLPFILFNLVTIEHDGATLDALASAIGLLRERGTAFVVNLRGETDDRFVGLLAELGLVAMSDGSWLPGMALFPIPPDAATTGTTSQRIRQVTDAAGLADHIRAGALGFEMPEGLFRAVMNGSVLEADDMTVYVGYVDDEPVTSGLGLRTGATVGIYNIATIPNARGRGYGGEMTRRVASDGASAGCDVAILQASRMGFPIYERLGYRTIVDYRGYVEPQDAD